MRRNPTKRIKRIFLVLSIFSILLNGCSSYSNKNYKWYQKLRSSDEYIAAFQENKETFEAVLAIFKKYGDDFKTIYIMVDGYNKEKRFNLSCDNEYLLYQLTEDEKMHFFNLSNKMNITSYVYRELMLYLDVNVNSGVVQYIYDENRIIKERYISVINNEWKIRRILEE